MSPTSDFLSSLDGLSTNLIRQYSQLLSTASLTAPPASDDEGSDIDDDGERSKWDNPNRAKTSGMSTDDPLSSLLTLPPSSLVSTLELQMLRRRLALETVKEVCERMEAMVEGVKRKVICRRVEGGEEDAEGENPPLGKKRRR